MEENKKRKINLIAILLIVAVVVNVAMSGYICYDKMNDNKVVAEYEANASDMQSKIYSLQEKIASSETISDSVNELQQKINYLTEDNEYLQNEIDKLIQQIDSTFTDDQNSAEIKLIKELFEKGAAKIMATDASEYEQYPMAEPYEEIMIDDWPFEKRDVLYSDVVKEYSEIFTDDALIMVLDKRFVAIEGYLYVAKGGASGWGIENIKIEKISESGDEITYLVKSECSAASGVIFAVNICTMKTKLVNGSYRISEIDYFQD